MRNVMKSFAVVGVLALAACNNSPAERQADNVEQAAENTADNFEDMADNATNEATEDQLENKADAARAAGDNQSDAIREGNAAAATTNGM